MAVRKKLTEAGAENIWNLIGGNTALKMGTLSQKAVNDPSWPAQEFRKAHNLSHLTELDIEYEDKYSALWCFKKHTERPNFTNTLIADIKSVHEAVGSMFVDGRQVDDAALKYLIWASRKKNIFNMGGDLLHFVDLLNEKDREGMQKYAYSCIEIAHLNHTNMAAPIITIALIQGDALGGGFEAVLVNDLVVAERGAQFGFPEILFGLFPGMGAYSLLSRKAGTMIAEEMIFSGRLYPAEYLHELGIVDVLADKGKGEEALYGYLKKFDKRFDAHQTLYNIRRQCNPVTMEELLRVGDRWVDTAMNLSELDIRKMRRLAKAQIERSERDGTDNEENRAEMKPVREIKNTHKEDNIWEAPHISSGPKETSPGKVQKMNDQSEIKASVLHLAKTKIAFPHSLKEKRAMPANRSFNSVYDRILEGTAEAKASLVLQPGVERLLSEGMSREEYLDFLEQLYHIVWHFCPTMAAAAARCDDSKRDLRYALYHDIAEEKGHELWVLNDIKALGGDVDEIVNSKPAIPVQAMIGYNYYIAERRNPYGVLGMIHSLEEISAKYAARVSALVAHRIGVNDGAGFSFLGSHGTMDMDHVHHFKDMVNSMTNDEDVEAIIEAAEVNYALFGALFREV